MLENADPTDNWGQLVIGSAYGINTMTQKLLRNWVNEGYLSYLEKYNNNLIQFSKTTRTTMPLNQATFDKYFQMYIFSSKKESQKKVYTQEECLTF